MLTENEATAKLAALAKNAVVILQAAKQQAADISSGIAHTELGGDGVPEHSRKELDALLSSFDAAIKAFS